MTNELQELTPESKVENPVPTQNLVITTPKKSNKNVWLILGSVIALICSCSILCAVLLATGVGKIMVARAPVEAVVDSFMEDMEAKDIESAYALFSPRSQRQTPISDLEKMIEGNNYILFEGYESVSIQNLNLSVAANTNPDLPQGTVANVDGFVSYRGGFTGQFEAVLEKVDGVWKIHYINIVVPPDKFQL